MKRICTIAGLVLAASILTGCATAPDEREPGASKAGKDAARDEYPGVVISVRDVEIPSQRSGVAPMMGAVIGGAVGSHAGEGRGASAGAVIGTVIGGVAGEAAAQAGTEAGVEITVRLDAGSVVAVTQRAGETFKPGERVNLVSDGATARVVKVPSGKP